MAEHAGKGLGVRIADLTWPEAESRFDAETVIVIPVGAASKEHGPHLPLNNDAVIAEYLTGQVLEHADVVVAPTIGHHYYPAFVDYPGSITLRLETARDLVVDVCTSLARHGPKRFYALNTGVSTRHALTPAVEILAEQGIVLRYTDVVASLAELEKDLAEQEGGTHADEIETSLMLHIAPEVVDMSKAVKDYHSDYQGPLSRTRQPGRTYSPSGCFGDPTLATAAKGKRVAEALVATVLGDIEALRATSVSPPG